MPERGPHLRVLEPPAAGCATAGCQLAAAAYSQLGLCWACERVRRSALVLCSWLFARDVLRFEHRPPGWAAATPPALERSPAFQEPPTRAGKSVDHADHDGDGRSDAAVRAARSPTSADLERLRLLVVELEAEVPARGSFR